MVDEASARLPYITRGRVDRRENIKQVLNIHVLRCDPLCFFEPWLVGMNLNRQPRKVLVLGLAQKWGRLWILGPEMVSERCQHRHEPVAPICEGEHAEIVDDLGWVGNRREQPF